MAYVDTTVSGRWMWLARIFSISLIAGLALALLVATALAAIGVLPWLHIDAAYGALPVAHAGMWVQIALTAFALGLCFFLPSDRRILSLEQSHRDFRISMEDVERAYRATHARDRDGAFQLKSEFDSVRERLVFLRDHPDLRALEPGVLEVAAQMSTLSRDLAETYSEEKVERARTFLGQRQEEIAAFDERLAQVHNTLAELKRWNQQLDAEETLRERRIDALEQELFALLPELGFEVAVERIAPEVVEEEVAARKPNVISLSPRLGG